MGWRRLVKAVGLAGLLASAIAAGPARACFVPGHALIHRELPLRLPAGMIVADVEIIGGDETALYTHGVLARVRRLVQGNLPGDWLVLHWPPSGDCDDPFRNGRQGYIIALERDRALAGPRVEPFPAVWGLDGSGRDDRLPAAFEIPQEWRRTPFGW
jgi:hypothetical protein